MCTPWGKRRGPTLRCASPSVPTTSSSCWQRCWAGRAVRHGCERGPGCDAPTSLPSVPTTSLSGCVSTGSQTGRSRLRRSGRERSASNSDKMTGPGVLAERANPPGHLLERGRHKSIVETPDRRRTAQLTVPWHVRGDELERHPVLDNSYCIGAMSATDCPVRTLT